MKKVNSEAISVGLRQVRDPSHFEQGRLSAGVTTHRPGCQRRLCLTGKQRGVKDK